MTTVGWIILVILLVPAVGLLGWLLFAESLVRIPPGSQAILLINGRPTNRVLPPGVHIVPALRRRTVAVYPAVELSYRALPVGETMTPADTQTGLDSTGPPVAVFLGDRTRAVVGYTARYRLSAEGLRTVHERFGPDGIPALIRDRSAAVVVTSLGAGGVGVESLFGERREEQQRAIADALRTVLDLDGIELGQFSIGAVDLGRTGEVIQGAARAGFEVDQENARAAVRAAQAANDRDLDVGGGPRPGMGRYREFELWQELILRRETLNVTLAGGARIGTPGPADPAVAVVPAESGPAA